MIDPTRLREEPSKNIDKSCLSIDTYVYMYIYNFCSDSVRALIFLVQLWLRLEIYNCAIFPFVRARHAKLRISLQQPLFILHVSSHQRSYGFIVGAHAVSLIVYRNRLL